jgi:CRISPR/Cas system-associated endonuclease Cas1
MSQMGQKQTRCFAPVCLLPPGADIVPPGQFSGWRPAQQPPPRRWQPRRRVLQESRAAAAYWRCFQDAGLRERKSGNLPRSWMRFARRGKGNAFFGPKHAAHPINAMLNYCYVVEAGRLANALAAQGLALPIGYLHSDKKGRNSLVWDAIEP